MTDGVLLFDIAAISYLVAFTGFVFSAAFQSRSVELTANGVLILGWTAHSTGLVLRGFALGAFPVTTTYESLIFYGWVFALGYLVTITLALIPQRVRNALAIFISLLTALFMALASSPLRSTDIAPLVPALRSHWLALHVGFVFVGEGFFTLAFASSLLYLWGSRRRKETDTAYLERLDRLSYQAISVGFPFFTLGGLFFGAIWAKHAWGRYWGWDPKETFMLVTWLVYVLYLHVRVQSKWQGRRAAWLAVLGFLLALFTFAGVNFLLPGLHSYR